MKKPIPYFNLSRQYDRLVVEFAEQLLKTAASGHYILGPAVENFEKAFAQYCGVSYGIGVGSGTDALIFALRALGVEKGDEVIVPSFTFSATAFCVIHLGAIPVFADIDSETFTLAPESVEKAITKRTKAMIPVHLYGQCADMDALSAIARKRKIKIVEDACQAHGASYKGKKTGSFGDAAGFSFYHTKNRGAMGDGGMVGTRNEKLVEKIWRYRNLGRHTVSEPHWELGWTSRLDAMQASILEVKLKNLDKFNEDRRRVAARYFKRLENSPLMLPREGEGRHHVYHLFVVRVPGGKRDALREHLTKDKIQSMLHYPLPVHRQPFARKFSKDEKRMKVTNQVSKEIISLPMFPEMTNEEVDQVCESINRFYHAH